MPDIFSYELIEGLRRDGCSLCRVVAIEERHWIAVFRREARRDPDVRRGFFAAGGFCPRHAWLFHGCVNAQDASLAIVDVYGALLDHDLASLRETAAAEPLRRRKHRPFLARTSRCQACVAADDALARQTYFFVEALHEEPIRRAYLASDGLCAAHIAAVLDYAFNTDEPIAWFLFEDWRNRLTNLRALLTELDRKRDHRYVGETPGPEALSWTEVIRRYGGEYDNDGK